MEEASEGLMWQKKDEEKMDGAMAFKAKFLKSLPRSQAMDLAMMTIKLVLQDP